MDNPCFLQEGPDLSSVLPQGGGDRQQPASADAPFGGLHAMADLALDHRRTPCPLGRSVGGFDALALKEGPEGFLLFEKLAGQMQSLACVLPLLQCPEDQRSIHAPNVNPRVAQPALAAPLPTGRQHGPWEARSSSGRNRPFG